MISPANESSPAGLPTGSRVTLVGFHTFVNNRRGVVVGAPSRGSTRHEVYIFRSSSEDWNAHPLFIQVQPRNLRPSMTTIRNDTLRTHPSRTVPHPLTTLQRTDIHDTIDKRIAPKTYFFGTVPPTYLLRGVPLSKQSADILVLACGDIRSVLYTVSRRAAAHGSLPKLRITLNDIEPCIMARNIVLLWLILRTPVRAVVLFEIWFSLRISEDAYAAIVEAVDALTGPDREHELRYIGLEFYSDSDRIAVYQVLEKWLPWRDKFNPDELFAIRANVLKDLYGMHGSSAQLLVSDSIAARHEFVRDEMFPKVAASREIEEYISTGCVFTGRQQIYLNPTMFKSPDEYSLHIECIPYNAFPSFAAYYDETTPLRSACMDHLKVWVKSMRKHGRHLEYVVNMADCLAFAMGLKGPFDIVAMSNITDTTGLLPILQATRGLVAPSGYMFTETVKLVHNKGFIEGYLRTHLGLPLELVPAVLGWRCVGWEGKNNPDHCVVNAIPKNDGRSSKALLTWEPTGATNVPLDAAACADAKLLYTSVRDRMWMSLASRPNNIHDVLIPLRMVNPLTLIPVFASASNVAKLVDPEARATDVEFGDVLGFVTAGTPRDLAMASVALLRSPLRVWGANASDLRGIFTVRLDSGVPYSAIEMCLDENTDSWILSWTMSRERAKGVKKVDLMYLGSAVVSVNIDDVRFSDLSWEQWNSWLQRASCSPMGAGKVRRVERDDSCDIIFDIPEGWMDAASDGNLFVTPVRDCSHSVELVNPVDGKAQRQTFRVPYPIDRVYGNIQVDAVKKEAKFEVQKAKYSLKSLFLPDSQNKSCWFKTTTVPPSYVKLLVRQQFSPDEFLRMELGHLQVPSVCTCKVFACEVFLTASKKASLYFLNEDKETGRTHLLILDPGAVRRDECTASLAVDVKWMHKTQGVSPLDPDIRNKKEWSSYSRMSNAEFEAVSTMLELHRGSDPETAGVQSGFDFLMESNAPSRARRFPGTRRLSSSSSRVERRRSYTPTNLMCGWRIGHTMLTPLMWPGRFACLKREGSLMLENVHTRWQERVEAWLKRGREHARRGHTEFALVAFEQGAGQGLSKASIDEHTTRVDALVECLLEAAATRVSSRDRKNCDLICACCSKAIALLGDSHSQLRRKAEKIRSKAVDMAATDSDDRSVHPFRINEYL